MTHTDAAAAMGTADIHDDGATIRRSTTIRQEVPVVERAWKSAGIAGIVTFRKAPGDRGTEVRVEAPRREQHKVAELVGALLKDDPGDSLTTALRQLKARLETGETPTTQGQPSGRKERTE